MTRYVAYITLEADTPLKVGSNASDFLQDSPVQKDWNNLPMILGTSIAGVLRKEFSTTEADDIFGNDNGSKVIFSNALLLDEKNRVNETLLLEKSKFLKIFDNLPIREHTAITDKGVAKEHSKFDEEVVYKGTRFIFSIEMVDNEDNFYKILELLQTNSFRIGGASTKGFGKFKTLDIKTQKFDEHSYKDYNSSLNTVLQESYTLKKTLSQTYTTYTLKIEPDNFFMFGSGFGDIDADMTPVYEQIVDYENKKLSNKMVLIPASSIKGAISHRTTFYYNKIKGNTIENGNGIDILKEIFGEAKNSKKDIYGSKGKLLISDCFKKNKNEVKTFDHVSIDRFTGGALDGALFQEKTIAQKDEWGIEILLEKGIDLDSITAFEKSLDDICSGMLALGGATTKGHGIFSGEWSKYE